VISNTVKRKFAEGKVAIGASCGLGSPYVARILAQQGFDFVLVDNQHGTWDRYTSAQAFLSIQSVGSIPFTRVQQNDFYAIGRLLDEGAMGIAVPMVETRDQAEQVAAASRYPPIGGRSIGPGSAALLGDDYMDWIDSELAVLIQIESALAIENAEAIMSVDGIDGCWLGPADLGADIGYERDSPEHDAAVMRMIEACKKFGKAPGLAAGTVEQGHKWAERGCQFMTVGADSVYLRSGPSADLGALADILD
jgi:4-hydroxy-2-oxoheptanedioate aldolase